MNIFKLNELIFEVMIQLLDSECLQVQEISLQNHITFYKKIIFQEKY